MGARIGKVKFKSGGSLTVLPPSRSNIRRVVFGWGEVTLRCHDGQRISNADVVYMLEAAKKIIRGG